MNRPIKLALLFGAAVALGHAVLVLGTPHFLMNVAMKRVSNDGKAINQFVFGPRTTQNSRNVVRPSPDLAYSTCAYDLAAGPLLVEAAPSPNGGYVSISVFAANTDNIAVFDTSQSPQGIRFVLARTGQKTPAGERVVLSPSDRGIVLDRRLAPNQELFAAADQARRGDTCAPIGR
ncbi:MAG: DUF1254 domain-containing protein [Novosphingobium sp.]